MAPDDSVYRLSERNVNNSEVYRTTKIGWEHINDYIYQYEYDVNGNITEISRRNKNTETTYSKLQQFAYDDLNQLIRADDLAKNCTEVYEYDNGGNITSVTTYPLTWGSLEGVTADKTVNYAYGDANWKDKLTSYNGETITYDAIGNPLSYKGYTLTWQNGRQLASLSGNGLTASYTYDVDGLRTSKTVNGVKHEYYYIGERLQHEKYGNVKLWFFYDSDGNPSGVRYTNGTTTTDYHFVCNWRGDVIGIYDVTGALLANYKYDAWGNIVSVTDSNGEAITDPNHIANVNPIRYRGYYYDSETGLYYVSSRYYDTEIDRFITLDTIDVLTATPTGLTDKNLYAYCDNNPIVRVDRGGQVWETVFDVISLGASIVEVSINPQDPWAWAGLVGDVVDLAIPFVGGIGEATKAVKTTTRIANNVDAVNDATKSVKSLRRSAVKKAWKNERNNVINGGPGSSRLWTSSEKVELLKTGKVKGYHGHHMFSVNRFPSLAGESSNIQFLTPKEHLCAHRGNWRNATFGPYVPRR